MGKRRRTFIIKSKEKGRTMESEFVDLVHRMRKAQKEYFKSRDKAVLKKSPELLEVQL